MPLKPDILILVFSPVKRDPRVYRQILFLREHYNLTVVGFGESPVQGIEFYTLKKPPRPGIVAKLRWAYYVQTRQFEKIYWTAFDEVHEAWEKLKDKRFDIIFANDLNTLPLALKLAQLSRSKVLFDAHEYFPRQYEDNWLLRFGYQRYYQYLCTRYLSQADAMMTVCEGIAQEYTKQYGVACQVVTNAPFYEDLSPQPVSEDVIRMIYHGGIHPSRKIENMIYLMDLLDERFKLDFILVATPSSSYLTYLQRLAHNHTHIRFLPPFPMMEIARSTNSYDIGLFLLSPDAFSYRMALPNKLFEFIQARLAVAIWPSPEMAKILKQYQCGVVADDFTIEAMAEQLNKLTSEDIMRYKHQAHQAAKSLSAETNQAILRELVAKLLQK